MSQPAAQKRTNVQISPVVLTAFRAAFGVLERVAPAPGAILAERMWCHVPTPKGNSRLDLRPGPGEAITATVGNRRVVAEAWGEGPTVYLSAGWGGWRGQLGALVSPVVEAGYRAVAFDPLSHGESDAGSMGRRAATIDEFADSLTAVVGQAGPAHAIVAHSVGCNATALAVGDGLTAGRLVFISPMADPTPYIDDFCHILGVGDRVRAGMVARLERRIGRSLRDFDAVRLAPRLALPLLVVHDHGDKETRFSDSEALVAAWPGSELVATDGLGHRRILTDPSVIRRVTDFVTVSSPAVRTDEG